LLQDYDGFVQVHAEPIDIDLGGTKATLLPWVCSDNYERCMNHANETDAQILFGHLELAGFEMYRGAINDHGMDSKLFNKFDMVMSGHFHHRSSRGNIYYLGTPYEMTWSDFNDPKGFHIFDTETRELTFIENPYKMFQKWYYDDTKWTDHSYIDGYDFEQARDSFIKVIVKNKTNPYWFDMYIDRLEKSGTLDIQVVDDNLNLQLEDDGDIIDEAEDTLTILKNYASLVNSSVDNDKLNAFLSDLYTEALSVE
jgi:DNA repair exonuclease SbcCD nuclease subunit